MKTLRKENLSKPNINPVYDFSTPTDIINGLREDDKNSLMFGRSNQPTDAMTENSGKSEILRGYVNSGGMGDQYGTFTGMTLYGGPDMYDQNVLSRVFDYGKYKTQKRIDLREATEDIRKKSAAVQEYLDKPLPLSASDEQELAKRQEELFRALLSEENRY